MPPIQKKSVVPKKQASKVWRISNGDTLETILMVPLQSVFCASKTLPNVTRINQHLLINIHHLMFSLGHQGLPRLPQSLEKPPSSIPQEGVRGYGEGGGGGGGE